MEGGEGGRGATYEHTGPKTDGNVALGLNNRESPVIEIPLQVHRGPLGPRANCIQPCIGEPRQGEKGERFPLGRVGERVNKTRGLRSE